MAVVGWRAMVAGLLPLGAMAMAVVPLPPGVQVAHCLGRLRRRQRLLWVLALQVARRAAWVVLVALVHAALGLQV